MFCHDILPWLISFSLGATRKIPVRHHRFQVKPDAVELLTFGALEHQGTQEIVAASSRPIANFLAFLFLLLTLAPGAQADQSPLAAVSEQDKNKAVARRVFDEIFNQGKFEVADEIYAPDFVNHGLKTNANLQEDQAAVHQEKEAFPDLKMSVELMVAEGDLVTVVWVFRGTHTHAGYGGLPPTGARIEMRGITVWRIVDGKIRDEWTSFNELTGYMQVLRHLRWFLLGFLLALILLAWKVPKLIRNFRRRNKTRTT
jgi:steroid delta-isomerase-like uncharacterized protein